MVFSRIYRPLGFGDLSYMQPNRQIFGTIHPPYVELDITDLDMRVRSYKMRIADAWNSQPAFNPEEMHLSYCGETMNNNESLNKYINSSFLNGYAYAPITYVHNYQQKILHVFPYGSKF